mgnify:CR=1 FL=1
MATPASRSQLKEYALRNLGKPVIEINVDDAQLEDRLDEALQYFAQSTNGLQGSTFGTYKWDCAVGCSAVWGNIPPCSAPNGTWVKLVSCFVRPVNYTAGQANTPLWNGPYTNWFDTLTDIQNNGYAVNSVLNLLDVQTILTGSTMTNTNTCSNKTSVPVFGGLEELIVYISDPANGLQNTDVSTLVYDLFHSGYPLNAPVNNPPQVLGNSNVGQWNERCEALNQNWPGFGTWPNPQAAHRGHIGFFVVDFCDGNGGQQFTRYTDFISYMNMSMPSLGVTLNTPFAQMKSLLISYYQANQLLPIIYNDQRIKYPQDSIYQMYQ